MLNTAVILRNLGKRYEQKWAVRDVSLEISEAELFLVVGPNGAGKSTLLKLIAGIVEPTRGDILLLKENMKPSDPEARRHLGVLLHESFLYDELTVQENLEFFKSMYGYSETRNWNGLVEMLGINNVLRNRTSELSHGWRKKVEIARALIHHPRIVLFDEVFSGLDQTSCLLVTKQIIPRILADKTTIIMASHVIGFMNGLWHSKIQLNDGCISSIERSKANIES